MHCPQGGNALPYIAEGDVRRGNRLPSKGQCKGKTFGVMLCTYKILWILKAYRSETYSLKSLSFTP